MYLCIKQLKIPTPEPSTANDVSSFIFHTSHKTQKQSLIYII